MDPMGWWWPAFCSTRQWDYSGSSCALTSVMSPKDDKKGAISQERQKPSEQSGGKTKKNWSKGKVWDKHNNLVLTKTHMINCKFSTINSYAQLLSMRDWTLAVPWPGQHLRELLSKILIELVSKYEVQVIYTRNTKDGDPPPPPAIKDLETDPTNCTFKKIKLY